MVKRKKHLHVSLFFILFPTISLAKRDLVAIGSNIISGPYAFIHHMMHAACYIVGAGLVVIGFEKFQKYWLNSQETPLIVPVFYLLLGGILILLPVGYTLAINYIKYR